MHPGHSDLDVRGTSSIHRRGWRGGIRAAILGDSGGGIDSPGHRTQVGEVQDDEPVQAEHEAAPRGAARQHSTRVPAAGGEPTQRPLRAAAPGGRARRDLEPRARLVGNRLRGSSLDPPPWPGDRGRVPRLPTKGRTWRNAACVLVKLRSHLQQWKVLCDDNQAVLLQRCILLLDKKRGELMRIAWR
nr:uncharacterized protein LOC120969749 [Aegilops tauschii subsp. strangulata]